MAKPHDFPDSSLTKRGGYQPAKFFGWFFVLLFFANLFFGTAYFFTGSPFDIGGKYEKPGPAPDITDYPFKFSAGFPFPPAILNFKEISLTGGESSYEWTRINYMSQLESVRFAGFRESLGVPSILQIKDTSSISPNAMRKIAGKSHDDPAVFAALSERLAKLDSGWIAVLAVPDKSLNLFSPSKSGDGLPNGDPEDWNPALIGALPEGAVPDIRVRLSNLLPDYEYPLAIAAGKSAPLLIAGSHGSLLKLDESGRLIERAKLSGEWLPIGGIISGNTFVGMDIVVLFRRIIAIVFLITPILAYLSFAAASRKHGDHQSPGR